MGTLVVLLQPMASYAQTAISSATFTEENTGLTKSEYTASSPSDAGGNVQDNTSYLVKYGEGRNLLISSFTVGGTLYNNFVSPDTLLLKRRDASRQLIIFYEFESIETGPNPDEIILGPEQQDNDEAIYLSGFANAGYDNVFTNSSGNFSNIERVDVIYYSGMVTSSPSTAVFPLLERNGNDKVRMAAIKSLDANGEPSEYFPTVVQINNDNGHWGNLGQSIETLVLRRQTATSDALPIANLSAQNVHGSAVRFDELGIGANELVYGYSVFGNDVTAAVANLIDVTDATYFPTNTNESNGGADLISGISTAVASDNNLTRATGPGGYKAALNTWLKANVSESITTSLDGSTVTDWQDQWLGDNDATTLTTAPVYESDAAADINFNPTVDFLDALERGLLIANNTDFNTSASYATKSINIAFRTGNDISTKQQIYEQGSNDRGINAYLRGNSLYVGAWNIPADGTGGNWAFNSTSTSSISTETEYILTIEFNGNTALTGTVTAYLNGQTFGTIPSVGLLFADTDGIGLGDVNSQSRYDDGTTAAASFYGSIPEFIYCNSPGSFNASQRNRIESYLALKYGITLDQSTAVNYANSSGDIIFNTTNNASLGGYLEYNNDIAGIGRDDNSEFVQLSSQSENTASLVQVNRNTAIGMDDTWLIWGNDAGSLTPSRAVTKPETINERLQRVWRVAEENSIGVTDISFDLTGLGLGTNPDDFSFMVAGAGTGANFSSATLLTGGTFNGNVITFTDVNLTDGQYFTLGTQNFICTPGNVQDGLSLWLKADAEAYSDDVETAATNGDDVVYWGDQSRNNFDAQDDVNRSPTWIETDVNFNPGLNFPDDGGNNLIGFNLGSNYIFSEDADGGTHIFAAIEPIDAGTNNNTRQQKMIYSFGDRTGSQIGLGSSHVRGTIQTPGDNNNFTIAPNASQFIVEGDFDISAGASDTHVFNIDGLQVRTETRSILLNDAAITQASTHSADAGPVSIGRLSESNSIDSNDGRRYYGDIQEVIVYNEEISDLEAQQVRSYLAIKYGTTLTNNNDADATINETLGGSVVEGDYVASDGTTITFDYSDDTGFVSNIAGIGKDDDTCLEQKQSRSVNSGTILTIGLGEIAVNNAANANSFDDDLDFLTWGTDGASTAFANITTAGTPGTVNERMLRIWRAQDTGDVGATDISFDLTGLAGYSTDASDYQLITASGGDNTSLENGSTIIGGTFDGTVLTFENVDLEDGEYFTLGVSSSQCGPGGVTVNLQLWLKGNVGTNVMSQGSDITSWADQSGNSNNASATNAPVYNTNNHNFNPSVDFTQASSDNMTIADAANLSPDQQAVFLVGTINSGSSAWSPFIMKTASFDWPNGWGITRNNTTTEILYHKDSYADNNNSADYASRTITYDLPNIHTAYKDATDYYYSLDLGIEDTDVPGSTYQSSDNVIFLGASPSGTGATNNTTPNAFLEGTISEVIMFSDDLTAPERARVASYLAIKYGITLDDVAGGIAGDYTRADGTNIWDASDYSGYHNDVAGIGRDDLSCFQQKQSKSINSGEILAIGLGSIETTNADNSNSFTDNGDYLVWGHDDGATAQASAETVDVPSTVSERMTRVWRVKDTGTVGETEIQFDLSGLGYSANASDFRLIIADNASGGTMSGGTLTAGGTFNGSVLSFTGIDLTDGQYFTLGTALETCGPGGVNTNISLWLRADSEVFSDAGTTAATDAGKVAQWNDQSSPAFNASEANGGGISPSEPLFKTNEINYNPALFITDVNTTNNSFIETSAATNNTAGDMTLIAVFETAQNEGSNNNIDNTPMLIGAGVGGASNDYGLGLYQGELVFNAANNNSYSARSTTTYRDSEPYIATATRVKAANGAIKLHVNSLNVVSNTSSDDTDLDAANTWAIGNHSGYDNEAQFQGNIGEVIVFNRVLTDEEQARVESYLALKYGITRSDDNDDDDTANEDISDGIKEGDYVAGDGDVIWNYAARTATFFNDIAGIGSDLLSCFEQTRSKSENDDAIVDIEIDAFSANDSWLIWGNNDAPINALGNPEKPATINSRINREWQVQETGTVGTVSVTFDLANVTGTPTGDNNLTQVRMLVSTDDDFSTGVTLVAPSSSTSTTVTFDYDFTAGEGFYYTLGSFEQNALPIELLSFSISKKGESVDIKWSTASEENNAYYSIERSINGVDFETIALIDGAGTSQGANNYQFIDISPLSGISYYRIKQTDFSGEFSYSSIESIVMKLVEELKFAIMPNPINNGGDLKLEIDFPKNVRSAVMSVFDKQGKVLFQKPLIVENRLHFYNTSSLNSGIYFIRIQVDNHKAITKRLIIR